MRPTRFDHGSSLVTKRWRFDVGVQNSFRQPRASAVPPRMRAPRRRSRSVIVDLHTSIEAFDRKMPKVFSHFRQVRATSPLVVVMAPVRKWPLRAIGSDLNRWDDPEAIQTFSEQLELFDCVG